MSSLIPKLTGYFPAKYGTERLVALERFLKPIDEEFHGKIFEWIIENRDKAGAVGVTDIKQACVALGIGFRETSAISPRNLSCAACGHEYRFLPSVCDSQQLDENLHCRCPVCGMRGSDQLMAEQYTIMAEGKPPAWYERDKTYYATRPGTWGIKQDRNFFDALSLRAEIRADRQRSFGIVDKLSQAKPGWAELMK